MWKTKIRPMKNITKFLLLLILTGIIGVNYSFAQTKQCVIKSITLTKLSSTKTDGYNWDTFSSPDIFFRISTETEILLTTNTWDDADLSKLPVKFSYSFPYTLPYLNQKYKIMCYDKDGDLNYDDFIGGCSFVPKNYSTSENSYVKYTGKKISFTINLEWE